MVSTARQWHLALCFKCNRISHHLKSLRNLRCPNFHSVASRCATQTSGCRPSGTFAKLWARWPKCEARRRIWFRKTANGFRHRTSDARGLLETVKRAEDAGFSTAWFYDTQVLSADIFVAAGHATE